MSIKTCISRLVICSVFFLHMLITGDVIGESITVEAGEKNINIVYKNTDIYDNSSTSGVDANLLYRKQNNHQDILASVGLTPFTYISKHTKIDAGFRIIVADPLNYYLSAIALGAELSYQPATTPAFKFATALYYAAESLTFSDGEEISLITFNMDHELADDTFIRLGYRRIRTELANGITSDFDRGAYLGLSWSYK